MSFWGSFLGLLFRVLKGLGVGFYFLGWVPDGQRLLFLGGGFLGPISGVPNAAGGGGEDMESLRSLCPPRAALGSTLRGARGSQPYLNPPLYPPPPRMT